MNRRIKYGQGNCVRPFVRKVQYFDRIGNQMTANAKFLVYQLSEDRKNISNTEASEYSIILWQPQWLSFYPKGCFQFRFLAWWLFDRLGIFEKQRFLIFYILAINGTLLFRGACFPTWWRTPFIPPGDIQLGDLWTHPDHRNKGIACFAVATMLKALPPDIRHVWYICRETNKASISLARKSGFSLAFLARRSGGRRKVMALMR